MNENDSALELSTAFGFESETDAVSVLAEEQRTAENPENPEQDASVKEELENLRAEAEATGVNPEGVTFDSEASGEDQPLKMYKGGTEAEDAGDEATSSDTTEELTVDNGGEVEFISEDPLQFLVDPNPEEPLQSLVDPNPEDPLQFLVDPNPEEPLQSLVDPIAFPDDGSATSSGDPVAVLTDSTEIDNLRLSSGPAPEGDANGDGVVDERDISALEEEGSGDGSGQDGVNEEIVLNSDEEGPDPVGKPWVLTSEGSSGADWGAWDQAGGIDMNGDGAVDGDDKLLYEQSGGKPASEEPSVTDWTAWNEAGGIDLNNDGVVDEADKILYDQTGGATPTDVIGRPMDLDFNGDGVVDDAERELATRIRTLTPGDPDKGTDGDGTGTVFPDDLQDWNDDGVVDERDLEMVTTSAPITPVNGSEKPDFLKGQDNVSDVINGNGGDDRILGRGGNDELNGGDGRDTISGGKGDDVIRGGVGDDTLLGADGNDRFYGDGGNDVIRGGGGIDTVDFGGLKSSVKVDLRLNLADGPSIGRDTLRSIENVYGGDADDVLHGNGRANVLHGDDGADRISGNGGADKLFGEAGNDHIVGGAGDDVIVGGAGRDMMRGGAGNDVFDFNALTDSDSDSADLIRDFSTGDIIDLAGLGFKGLDDFTVKMDDGYTYLEAKDVDFGLKLLGNVELGDNDFHWV